ncbi:MAG: YciI family protein [Bacteroidia bacterium]
MKEIIGGFIIVTAESIDEAVKLATGCPALTSGERSK